MTSTIAGANPQSGSMALHASVASTEQVFMKYVYSFPLPASTVNFSGLSGAVSIFTEGDAPSEMLARLHYLPSGQCVANGTKFSDYDKLFQALPGSVTLALFIVKNFGAGYREIKTEFKLPASIPMSGCVFVVLDGGPSLGPANKINSLTMTSTMNLQYTTEILTDRPAPYVFGNGDEFCFGWNSGCQLSTSGQAKTFVFSEKVPQSGTIVAMFGDVSEGALSKPNGSWTAANIYYVVPKCKNSLGEDLPLGPDGPFSTYALPNNAISLLSVPLQGSDSVLQRPVFQVASNHVNKGDCIVHVNFVNGKGGVDAESQVKALIQPD